MSDERIYVTRHAARRFVERCPSDIPAQREGETISEVVRAVAAIYREITAAVAEGRRSASEPSWMPRDGALRTRAASNRRHGQVKRYVWAADKTRGYILQRGRSPKGGAHRWIVLTTIVKAAE